MGDRRTFRRVGNYTTRQGETCDCSICHDATWATILIDDKCLDCYVKQHIADGNKHIIKFTAGYDCMRFECKHGSENCKPQTGGSHGRHGLEIIFISQGAKGAVQFVIFTQWLPQYSENIYGIDKWASLGVMPADLGYHSKTPLYDAQTPTSESCEYCDGQPCYYDSSALNAFKAMYCLVNGGETALWEYLDVYYNATFDDGEYPKPFEYPKPLRLAGKP